MKEKSSSKKIQKRTRARKKCSRSSTGKSKPESKVPEKGPKEPKKRPQEETRKGKGSETPESKPQEEPKVGSEPIRVKDLILVLFAELSNKAWAFMGKIGHPETGQPRSDLKQARLAIDTIEALLQVARAHMDEQEIHSVETTLANLRINFVTLG